ncbi:MAG TPA: DMT family transporter [Ktedonobacterales bacterium]
MSFGVVFGLTAALCWGVADFFARSATRSGGTFRTLLSIQIIATVTLLAVAMPLGLLHLTNLRPGPTLVAALLGLIILSGAGLLYRAFAIGTLAIVSPIAASYAAITALLAMLLSREQPRLPQLIGIICTLGGVILASAVSNNPPGDHAGTPSLPVGNPAKRPSKAPLSLAPGLPEALLSMLLFGVAYWALRFVVADLGGVTVAFIAKASDLIALLLLTLAVALLQRHSSRRTPAHSATLSPLPTQPAASRWNIFLLAVIPTALLDTAANIAYNLGIAGSLTSIVAVISSLFSAVTVLLAWIFLRERLSRWQWVGTIAIFLGIALVSI